MRKRAWAKAIGAAAILATAGSLVAQPRKAAAPAAKPAAARDWARTVVPTPEGGFRIGNPAAPLKVVEYGSFTCSHCAAFAKEGVPLLVRDHVRSGKVSFEYRMFVRDPYDVTAALVARCAPPETFFRLSHDIFATHDQWLGRLQGVTPDQVKSIDALPVGERLARLASIAGFDAMAVKAGVPAPKVRQCLMDDKAMDQLIAMRQLAVNKLGLRGTPTFVVNGKMTDAHGWTELQPLLKPPRG
jgi:protein-disulfide isomerase